MITQALCATDLRKIQPKVICCTGCDREIAELPNDCGFKDLPSEHWAEMMEVWMCHSDPGFTAQISAQTKDGFWPSEGIVLVGGSYLLLRDEYTKKHNLVTDSTSVSVPPYPVHNSPFLCIYPLILQYLSLHLPRYPPRGLQEGRRHSLTGGLAPSLVPTVRSSSKFRSVFTGCRVRQGCLAKRAGIFMAYINNDIGYMSRSARIANFVSFRLIEMRLLSCYIPFTPRHPFFLCLGDEN
jgi:hypothetical protein